ncbi:hypothetical protein ASF36_23445 [Methylobacterium sp. Leaf90]|nr:hypothetical protein ASF36_23445 [Methylobacterium sp. Leaf90]
MSRRAPASTTASRPRDEAVALTPPTSLPCIHMRAGQEPGGVSTTSPMRSPVSASVTRAPHGETASPSGDER